MSLYRFVAKDINGKKISGEVESMDERGLVTTLQKEGLIPIEIKKRETEGLPIVKSLPKIRGGVSFSDVVGFTRQLSTMISAGLPLADSLVILEKQAKNQNFAHVLAEVLADVEGGMALSGAMAKHPKVFDIIYVKLVEAGETGGVLDKILAKLAETQEKEREFKAKTRGAFIYPVIVVSVMIIVITIMMIFVIPKLTSIYTEIGATLPLPTKILIATSNFTRSFWWLVILGIFAAFYAISVFSKTERGAELFSKIVLSLPIWGKIRKALILSQFTRTLGLLIGAGIPIIAALKVVSEILAPFAADPAFPPIIGQMIRVGEETGKMDEVLARLSVYFEGESENAVRNLTTALEPIILVVLGVGVGVLVLSVILPIYNLTAQF
ncbi:type II secretion system F family protein [Candidatus Curtissbacteria bacterium]|nr:type II secretion system F family protein [Candidatus Curtissbacteria bacterium]